MNTEFSNVGLFKGGKSMKLKDAVIAISGTEIDEHTGNQKTWADHRSIFTYSVMAVVVVAAVTALVVYWFW